MFTVLNKSGVKKNLLRNYINKISLDRPVGPVLSARSVRNPKTIKLSLQWYLNPKCYAVLTLYCCYGLRSGFIIPYAEQELTNFSNGIYAQYCAGLRLIPHIYSLQYVRRHLCLENICITKRIQQCTYIYVFFYNISANKVPERMLKHACVCWDILFNIDVYI